MNHTFLFSQFRITNAAQVEELRALGMSRITYIPERSTAQPLPVVPDAGVASSCPPAMPTPSPQAAMPAPPDMADKQSAARYAAEQRARISRCEQAYARTAAGVRDIMRGLFLSNSTSLTRARTLISEVANTFAKDAHIAIHLMNRKLADDNAYFHPLNVTVLSMLLARSVGMHAADMNLLGEGALFHDIGKGRVPDSIVRNPTRNRHEEEFFRLHTAYGLDMARDAGIVDESVLDIIRHHHEAVDGVGYPDGLCGEAVSAKARIVALVNRYDNLCNPVGSALPLTPAEAVAHMYGREARHFDQKLLQLFIRSLGVYPPGSIVQLSNGNTGLVLAVDSSDLMHPTVMTYEPDMPRTDAPIVNLSAAPEVTIDRVLRFKDLSPHVLEYLAPQRRISYFPSNERLQ